MAWAFSQVNHWMDIHRVKWQPAPVLLPRKPHGRRSLLQATVHGVAKSQTRLSDFTHSASLNGMCRSVEVLVIQSCLTLWDPVDYSLSDSSVHGVLKARLLEWIAVPFSRGSS